MAYNLRPNTIVIAGSARLPENVTAKHVFGCITIELEIDPADYTIVDVSCTLLPFLGEDLFDYILVNKKRPPQELIEVYSEEGDIVENDLEDSRLISADILGPLVKEPRKDLLRRSLIRHDSKKLAKELMKIVTNL